ncbi:helix-turn-helix transcriptional regulator [Nocardia sp. NPDC048505]|uniref:helix-turn-helix domain-containing protein n=1 Tax=unclassified Nocardia TaxID=2637762 RepID=UPI0033FAAB7E
MGSKEAAIAINRAVGNELRAARARRDLTRQQLADQTGLAVSTIQRFENGERSPDMPQLLALCTAFEVSVQSFVDLALRNIDLTQD